MEVDTSCSADSYLQMGALCGDPGDQAFLYYDVFIECGKDNGYTNVEGNATCSESVLVNSFASEPGTISPTLIHTDYRWELLSSDICYTFKEGETPSPSDTPAPITPTSSPITPDTPTSTQETAGPTSSPTDTTVDIAIGEGDTIYSATYSARYKHILDDDCEGPAPDIAVFCLTGQLEVLDTSDDSIVCVGPLNLNGSTAALCSNTCDNEECESVYVDRGLTNPSLYGLIDFKCTGPEVDDVQGALFIPGSTTGSCSGGSGSNGFNILSASLGVSCDGQVLYDDEHTECVSGNPVNLGLDEYECISGNRCSGEACSVTIDDISFTADHFRFPECIETSDGSTVSTIDLPTSEPLPAGSYTAIFSSNVQIEVDEDDEGTCIVSATDAGLAVLRLTCLNGAIKLHRQPAFLTCAVVGATGSGTMECTEATSTLPVNEWGSVVYVSGSLLQNAFLSCGSDNNF